MSSKTILCNFIFEDKTFTCLVPKEDLPIFEKMNIVLSEDCEVTLLETQYSYVAVRYTRASSLLLAFRNIRRVVPNLMAKEIIGVQPMTAPTGSIFSMKTRYSSDEDEDE